VTHLEGLVFSGPGNTPVYRKTFRRVWTAACDAAGVGRVRPGWLRHTGASIAYGQLHDLKTVAHRLGHTSTRMVDTVYVELYGEADRSAADAIDKAFRSSS
jgi:integrase